jgi:K+-sensing histidine kinase KdpD
MAGKFPARILRILIPLPRQRVADRYAIAISSTVLAILLRWLLDPVLGHVAFYVTLYVAVTFSAMVCGFAPAILSGLLGFLGIFYWLVDPRHSSLSFTNPLKFMPLLVASWCAPCSSPWARPTGASNCA